MLFKLTRGVFIALILTCCGCQERQSSVATASSELSGQHKDNPADPTVMVYYFHRTARCFSCLSIEANAAQVIKDNFRQQMADGRLMWMPFNLDDPGGEEFNKEFDITTSTLVVARTAEDNRVRYKKLEEVWQLLGDPEGFSEYVTDRINKFLNDR
jgi:MFS superfamily sulfate permease-like transporter